MEIKTINIKKDFPPADVAVSLLEIEIETYSNSNVGVLKVIHGYGSHGIGGEIKHQLTKRLGELKKQCKILDFIPGEKFGETQKNNQYILQNFPALIIDSDLSLYNSGITLIFLNNKNK